MIIASVRFALPEGTSLEDARELYEQNLSAYESAPGLITKYYVFGNGKGGGIYLWESREAAGALLYAGMARDDRQEI